MRRCQKYFLKYVVDEKRCLLEYPVHDKIYFKNIQVVTDSSSDSPLLRPSGSGRPRTVYLERVSDIHASQTFDGQKMLPQDINLERNGSGLSRATSLGEGLHRWQCNVTLSHISISQNCVTSPDDISQHDRSPLHLPYYEAYNATDWRGAKMFQTGRCLLLSSTVSFIQSVSNTLAR